MPIQSRRDGDSIVLDNVDFKRIARRFLQSGDLATRPKDINQSMEMVSRLFGYPDLHSVTAESKGQPLAGQSGDGAAEVGAIQSSIGDVDLVHYLDAPKRIAVLSALAKQDPKAPVPFFVVAIGGGRDDWCSMMSVELARVLNPMVALLSHVGHNFELHDGCLRPADPRNSTRAPFSEDLLYALLDFGCIDSLLWRPILLDDRPELVESLELKNLRRWFQRFPGYEKEKVFQHPSSVHEQFAYVAGNLKAVPRSA